MAIRMNAEDASLETLVWLARDRDARDEEDPEAELEKLIKGFVDKRTEILPDEEGVRGDEFECDSCHLVAHRSRLAGGRRKICIDCAAKWSHRAKVRKVRTAA